MSSNPHRAHYRRRQLRLVLESRPSEEISKRALALELAFESARLRRALVAKISSELANDASHGAVLKKALIEHHKRVDREKFDDVRGQQVLQNVERPWQRSHSVGEVLQELLRRIHRASNPGVVSGRVEQPLFVCVSENNTTIAACAHLIGASAEVVATKDQNEALDLIKFDDPAAVIFDMVAEHFMAGLEALHLHCRLQDIPLIAIARSDEAAALAETMSVAAVLRL